MGFGLHRYTVVLSRIQDLFNDCRVFDTGNDFDSTSALFTGFDVDVKFNKIRTREQRHVSSR